MSQSATINTLNYIRTQTRLYGYIVIFVTGCVGNTFNIFIFATKLKESVCSRYLLVGDVSNNICLLITILPNIIGVIYGKKGTESSLIWCKIYNYLLDVCYLTSTWTLCLASVDRYLCSSRQASRRKWSSMKVANWSIAVTIVVSLCLAIPDLPYWYIDSDARACVSSESYRIYLTYFLFSWMMTVGPLFVLVILGYKTYHSLRASLYPVEVVTRNARRQRMDNQLARMMLVQIIVFLFQSVTLFIYFVYQQITTNWIKTTMHQTIQNLAQSIIYLINYSFLSTSFYIYYLQSSRYRAIVHQLLAIKKRQLVGGTSSHQNNMGMLNTSVEAQRTIEL